MKLGIQLYSLGREMDKSFENTIKSVAEIGYDGVEFAGYYGKSAKEVKQIVLDNGMEISSTHTCLPEEDKWVSTLDFAAEAGIPAIIIPWMGPESWFPKCTFDATIAKINRFSDLARTYGIKTGFHNHYMEFVSVFGKTIMEQLHDNTADDFILEVDCCWAQFGTGNAEEVLKKLKNKSTTICHYKQLLKDGDTSTTTLDKGCINFANITKFLKENNAEWAIVEQERIEMSELEAAKINHDYIRSIL